MAPLGNPVLVNSIPPFSGEAGSDLVAFKQAVTQVRALAEWSDADTIKVITLKCTGSAASFVLHEPSIKRGEITKAEELFSLLESRFEDRSSSSAALYELMVGLTQEPHENVRSFADRLREVAARVQSTTAAETDKKFLEETIKFVFLRGLLPHLRRFVQATQPKDLREAVANATKEETNERYFAASRPVSDVSQQLAAVNLNSRASPRRADDQAAKERRACYNCQATGHLAAQCPERSSTPRCYSCNRRGHFARDCRQNRRPRTPSPRFSRRFSSPSPRRRRDSPSRHFRRDFSPDDRNRHYVGSTSARRTPSPSGFRGNRPRVRFERSTSRDRSFRRPSTYRRDY